LIFNKYRVEIKNDNAVSYYYYNVENSHPISEEELEKDLNSILEQYQEALDYYKQSTPKQLEPQHTLQKNDAYSVKDIVNEGCFLDQKALECILERFRDKKNLILQGPPGTGKSWLAKRLAFALMGARDFTRIRAVQFHPNLSYEDFIRGWRPAGDGKLALVDGPFMEIIEAAKKDADNEYVVVIEEINRGNPAQIFGEMLTLLEADKRKPEEALELSYKRAEKESVFVPENLYVIGTINIADRSLALVDFAFRRRFAFVELMPLLDGRWPNWVHENCKIKREIVEHIAEGIKKLNEKISKDRTLGPQCQIGHSYVTPNKPIPNPKEWFSRVIETEIEPLLEEYWFDSPTELKDAKGILEDAKKRIQA
jgi:5-methylcytosine-specific restriction protein B